MKKNVDKSIEDKTEKTDDEKNSEMKNKTCVTFAVENEQVNVAKENQKKLPENESNKGPLQCPLVPASEVQYNRIEMQEQAADAANTVIVHSDAKESNAIETIPTSGPPKQEEPMEESSLDNHGVTVEKVEGDKSEQAELQEEESIPETAEDEVLQPDVVGERVEEPTGEESEENTPEVQPEVETVPCHTMENTIQETVPEQEQVQSKLNPSEQGHVSDDIECANQPEKLIDIDEQECLEPNQSEFVLEPSLGNDLNSLDQISKENERESRPIDNESVNSTTAQVDDPMEDFDVENEPVDEEPELNQTPPPLLEDEEYEGTYIVREPGVEDEYQYDPSENDQQDPVPDDTLPSPPVSPDSDPLPSPPTAPVSDGEEYDESEGEEAPPVPPQDYNMPNKSYQISSEPGESQPITTNGFSEQRRPESFGTVDTAVWL